MKIFFLSLKDCEKKNIPEGKQLMTGCQPNAI